MAVFFKKLHKTYRTILIIILILLIFLCGFVVNKSINKDSTINVKIDKIIAYNMNLSYTQQVFNRCSVKENTTEKFFCVNQYVVQNFNNVPREGIYSIDEMFDTGADCKSYAVYYATLAKMMDYDYLFVQLPTHIFTMVYFKEGYCILDQKFYDCFYYEENISEELING